MISIVFGAGASFGSGHCSPYNPPLGNDLFKSLDELGGVFSQLDADSKAVFNNEGFEAGMATVPDDSRILNPLQKELACYLSRFMTKPDNAYVRLFNKLRRRMNEINIMTLNYDLLIEQSLSYHNFSIDYRGENKGVNLLKLHGSSNFLPQLPKGSSFTGNTMINCRSYFEGFETKAVSSHDDVEAWCSDQRHSDLSPVLAMYAKGKRVLINNEVIQRTQEKYVELISSSSLVVLVGIKYIAHDTHIWGPICDLKPNLLIIDPYPQDTKNWLNNNHYLNSEIIPKSFDESIWDITKFINKS